MLAYHYSKSENVAKAYNYLKASAEKTLRNDAVFEAIRFYKEAMEVLSQLPQTDDWKREQLEVFFAMQMPLRRIGYLDDYLPLLEKAEKLAEDLGDDKKKLIIHSFLGHYYIFRGGDPQLGWKYIENCVDHPEILQDVQAMVPIGINLCSICIISGELQRIKQVAPTIVTLIEHWGSQAEFFGQAFYPRATVLACWGVSTAGSGDFEQGERLLEKALTLALEIDHRATVGFIKFMYGCMLAMKGDGHRAIGHLQNAIKYMEESQTVLYLGLAWAWLGYAHCLTRQPKSAVDLTEKGLKMHTDLGLPFWRSLCHWVCSVAHFELGDREKARTHTELALQFSLENNERQIQGISRMWGGRVLAKTDAIQIEAVEQHLLQGINLLEELEIRAQYSLGYLWLGEVYAESGRLEEASANLKKAEAMFQEMGMDYWLGKAREALTRR